MSLKVDYQLETDTNVCLNKLLANNNVNTEDKNIFSCDNLFKANQILDELRETRFSDKIGCPHCQGKKIIRFGNFNGTQRYRCNNCGKTFSDLTNTPIMGTHYPGKWILFIISMLSGLTLRKSSKVIGVSYVTLFYWRHKLLKALSRIKTEKLEGIVEAGKIYFAPSEKGNKHIEGRNSRKHGFSFIYSAPIKRPVYVMVAKDRFKNTVMEMIFNEVIGRREIENSIGKYLNKDNILCTDYSRIYLHFVKVRGIKHYKLSYVEPEIDGIYSIKNVNKYIKTFKNWISKFKGVASKYLENYLSWFKYLDNINFEKTERQIKEMFKVACST